MAECGTCSECYWWSIEPKVCLYPIPSERILTPIDEAFYKILTGMIPEYTEYLEKVPSGYWRWKNSTTK